MTTNTRLTVIIAAVFILMLPSLSLKTQETHPLYNELWAIHLKGGLLWNFYTADFTTFDGTIECGNFKDGNGLGPSIFLAGEYDLNKNMQLSLGLGYVDRSGKLSTDAWYPKRNDLNPQKIDTISLNNYINADIGYLEIQPDFRYVLTPKLINGPLRVFAGPRIGINIKNSFQQKEDIISPSDAVFRYNNKRTRDITGGAIPNISTLIYGFSGGLENMLKAGDNIFITQALSFDYIFNGLRSDITWNTWAINLTVGVRYGFFKYIEPPKPVIPPITPPAPAYPSPPDIDTSFVVEVIIPEPVLDVKITGNNFKLYTGNELLATLPLVNAVFFDRNSKDIPEKYVLDTTNMPSLFTGDAVNIQRYVIPRIALILKKNPDATITLVGASSGKYESGGSYLGRLRANQVKKAFLNLGIDESRITVKAKYKPEFESNQAFKLGRVENQRVDILVNNAPLQEYVALQRFNELTGNYFVDTYYENVNPDSGEVMLHSDFPDSTVRVRDSVESFSFGVNKLRIDPAKSTVDVAAEMTYFDHTASDAQSIPKKDIPTKVVDLVLDKFVAVIRFDYNSSELSEDNKGLLKQMSEFLPAGSTVIIYGSTDALGSDERNTVLANERAQNTANYIKEVSGDKFKIEWNTDATKFPEETPEGRFLNRNIKVRVRK